MNEWVGNIRDYWQEWYNEEWTNKLSNWTGTIDKHTDKHANLGHEYGTWLLDFMVTREWWLHEQ